MNNEENNDFFQTHNQSELDSKKDTPTEHNSTTSQNLFLESKDKFIKKLYQAHTKILEPNYKTHIKPLLQFYEQIPQSLTVEDIDHCIQSSFAIIPSNGGLRIDFLTNNIRKRITTSNEKAIEKIKTSEKLSYQTKYINQS